MAAPEASRHRRGTCAAALVSLGLWAGLTACAGQPYGWSTAPLEARHPGLAAVEGQRLADSPAYLAPGVEGVALLLCRWDPADAIPVWLPPDASERETAALRRALSAWEESGVGVGFRVDTWRGAPPRSGIAIELMDAEAPDAPPGAGSTIADCGLPGAAVSRAEPEVPVDAALAYASVHLRRSMPDLLGRPVPLGEDELVGAAVHELGHALGLPGHVGRRGSVMGTHGQVDAVRRWGRRLAGGGRLEAPTVTALYRLPSGVRVGWLPVPADRLGPLSALAAAAGRAGLRGPWVRVGSDSARILYRDEAGTPHAAVVLGWGAAQRQPARFQVRLDRRARRLVGSGP